MDFLAITSIFILLFTLHGPTHLKGSMIRLKTGAVDPSRVMQLSWNPRAFVYKGFLSDEECDHLIQLASGNMEKSMVVDNESGKSVETEERTSSSMFLYKAQDEVVAAIEERIAAWTFLPKENGESMQVLRYQNGDKNEPHYDYFHDKVHQQLGGHRIATVLMYLSNVDKGGETLFPYGQENLSQPKDETWSECAKEGNAVKPIKGDALLFYSLHLNATTDQNSFHGSCPVIEGEKWSATQWIHVRALSECKDENENCEGWAALGECTKNPLYMAGSEGVCKKSCGVCTS